MAKENQNDKMLPIWLKYPEIPQGSIGWRMGYGESYEMEFSEWYYKLTKEEQEAYKKYYPEPVCWSNSEWNIKRHDAFWIYNWQQKCVNHYSIRSIIEEQNAGRQRDVIYFWGHRSKEGEANGKEVLSQWYPADFQVGHQVYCCMEQYMMAKKAQLFGDAETEKRIMEESEQSKIKSLGRKVKNFDESVWNEFRTLIVMTGNYYKFGQLGNLRKYLLSTKDALLVEASPYDTIWGIGMSAEEARRSDITQWRGSNLLGFSLMAVRDELARIWHLNMTGEQK